MKIGFFDSGVGGITILTAVRNRLPQYDYIFFGDTANVPYGDKSEAEVLELTRRAVLRLFKKDAQLVILACNTASARTLRRLQLTLLVGKYQHRRILGVIVPTVEALKASSATRAFLIGTKRTIRSNKYPREILRQKASVKFISQATPELVPLIEANNLAEACHYLENLLNPVVGEIDALILGCTHYTVLKQFVHERFRGKFKVIAQDEIIPEKLEEYLKRHQEIATTLTRGGEVQIVLSKNNRHYQTLLNGLINARG